MRKLLEIASTVEPMQDGRIHIKKINGPMLYQHKATPAEYKAGLEGPSHAVCFGCTRAEPM